MTFRLFSILLLVALTLPGNAQQVDRIPFKKYGVKEGLPEEAIQSIVQDEQGYIWLTTQLSAVKFDGYKLKTYGGDFDDPNGLHIQNTGGGMIKGKDGKLWISGFLNGGVASYSPETKQFKNYLHNPDSISAILFPYCNALFEDSYKNIWFANSSVELDSLILSRLDQSSQQIFNYPIRLSFRSRNDIVLNYSIGESRRDSAIWIMERGRQNVNNLRRLNRETNEFELIIPSGGPIPGSSNQDTLSDIVPMGKSDLFVLSSSKNVYLWDPIKRESIKDFEFAATQQTSWSAFEDQKGYVWVSNAEKLTRYDRSKDELVKFEIGKYPLEGIAKAENFRSIVPVYQSNTDLWFDVYRNGPDTYIRYNYVNESFHVYDASFNFEVNGRINQGTTVFLEDIFGIKWFGTRPNLYKEDLKKVSMELFDKGSLPSDTINFLFEDSNEQLWVGTQNGLSLYDDATNRFHTYVHKPGDKQSLSHNEVRTIFEDNSRQLWVGTQDGLTFISQDRKRFKQIFTGLGRVFSISQDHKGNVWVAVFEDGVYILDLKGNIKRAFKPENASEHLLTSIRINNIFNDSEGRTWLGDPTGRNGIYRYNEEQNNFKHYQFIKGNDSEIHWITQDKLNNVWAGSDKNLKLYEPSLDSFVSFGNNRDGFFSLTSYAADVKGNFWVGTYGGGGLVGISSESGQYITKGESDGMLHSQVMVSDQIPMDHLGNLYLPTNRGLSVYNTEDQIFRNFDEAYGFQDSDRNYIGLTRKNGEVWIGGRHGLNKIIPEKLLIEKNMIPPKVWITGMTIMDTDYSAADGEIFTKAVDYTDEIELEYWQKDLAFEFLALHYLHPESNQYSWKLEGYDRDWSAPSLARTAAYTNLSPGNYTFRIKGSNADGIWNEEGDFITITITPPLWLSKAAFILYILLFAGIGYQVHRYQQSKTIRKEQDRIKDQQLAQAKEIEKAYSDLQHTQTQLIHSEKMASLGELTAGIAHEIQNPLNFVNNFSDLNKELLEELKDAVAQNDQEEVSAIIKDLSENETKINHHGKRAEEIVKSMLQHSRSGSSEKELTDINALVDEYLRLSYHGLRAKDKSFNADFKAELDPDLPKVKVISQDIGRVILNLINNAFQAVKGVEKPEVIVTTKAIPLLGGARGGFSSIQITVSDNGSGIPESIREKIFQPFFTTKPTGEGTGLGLSMSYDIVTKGHGGTISVESEEGKGTYFIITLPLNNNAKH